MEPAPSINIRMATSNIPPPSLCIKRKHSLIQKENESDHVTVKYQRIDEIVSDILKKKIKD